MSEKTLGKARGLNSIADPSDFRGVVGRRRRGEEVEQAVEDAAIPDEEARVDVALPGAAPTPANIAPSPSRPAPNRRKRRELSVPHDISEALEQTSINPADIVMSAYRRHGDAIYGGAGGRPVSRGRARLRLSLSDSDFDKVVRLGEIRGWNRSETVAVLVAFELLPDTMETSP